MANAKNDKEAATTTKGVTQPAEPTTAEGDASQNPQEPQVSQAGGELGQNESANAQQGDGHGDDSEQAGGEAAGMATEAESDTAEKQGMDADNQLTDNSQEQEPPSKKENRERIARDLFSKNLGLLVIYFTADLVPFAKEADALKHAAGLDNKTVTPITKED